MRNEVMTPEQVEAELLAFEEMELENVAIIEQHSQRNAIVVCFENNKHFVASRYWVNEYPAERKEVLEVESEEEGAVVAELLNLAFERGMSHQTDNEHRTALMETPTQLYGIQLIEGEEELPLLSHVFTSPVKAAQWVKKEYRGMQYSIVSVKVD